MSDPSSTPRPTLATVAKLAGTSVPTVSKVLRGGTDVSAETRDRVMHAVHEVGYGVGRAERPNGAPRSVRRPGLIDLVVSNVEGTWANKVLSGVERAASAIDTDVVIAIARKDGAWLDRLLRRPSEGAIVVLFDPTPVQLEALTAARIPVVIIDPMSPPPDDVGTVGVTNWEGGRAAGEHLLDLGHRRFGIIAGNRDNLYSKARVDGFASALADAGIERPRKSVKHGGWMRESARVVARQILRSAEPPTAIFACSDLMALGAYDAAAELGVDVPAELSVVGFDDVPEAEWAQPGLTTVQQPISEMGEAAFRMLLRMTEGQSSIGRRAPREQLSTRLIVRWSAVPVGERSA